MENAVPGEAYETRDASATSSGDNAIEEGNDILGKFNPGLGAQRFDIEGAAKFIPKGSDLVFELHYTTSGKPRADVSKLGLVLAKAPPQTRYFFHAGPTALNLAIPADDSNAEVVSEITFGEDARLVYAQPHMHLRGKDFELRVVSPRRQVKTVLKGNFELRVADGLSVCRAGGAAEGIEAADHQPLRQLAGQSLQPGSDEEDRVGASELGRDEQLLHRRPVPTKHRAREGVPAQSGPSLLPRGECGPTLASLSQRRSERRGAERPTATRWPTARQIAR